MSAKAPPKSREFCIIGDDGEPSDLALHAGILDEADINERLKERDAAEAPGPALSESDETDISDLDGLEDILDDKPA